MLRRGIWVLRLRVLELRVIGFRVYGLGFVSLWV